MVPEPLHLLLPTRPTRTRPAPSTTDASTAVPAAALLLRRLADPGQGALAALAFLARDAAQRGRTHLALQPLLEWLAEPCVMMTQSTPLHPGHARDEGGTAQRATPIERPRPLLELQPPRESQPLRELQPPPDARPLAADRCAFAFVGQQQQQLEWQQQKARQQQPGRDTCLASAADATESGCGGGRLELRPRLLGLPPHLRTQLQPLLAALPRCRGLYGSLDERGRLVLEQLLLALPRRPSSRGGLFGFAGEDADAMGNAGTSAVEAAAAASQGDGNFAKDYGSGGGGGSRLGWSHGWVAAALLSSQTRYRRQPALADSAPKPEEAYEGHSSRRVGASGVGEAVAAVAVAAARVGEDLSFHCKWKPGGGLPGAVGDGRSGREDGGMADEEDARSGGAGGSADGGWWWIQDDLDSACCAQDLDPGCRMGPGTGVCGDDEPPAPPGGGAVDGGEREGERRRRRRPGESHQQQQQQGDEDGKQEEEDRGGQGGAAAGVSQMKRPRMDAVIVVPEPDLPPPGVVSAAAAAASVGGDRTALRSSWVEVMRLLQDSAGGGRDVPQTSWQRLEALLEQCAAYDAPYTSVAAGTAALPPDAVLHVVRQLVTSRLSGAAARLLLAAAVLPAVETVDRVMPRPLQEALAAAAGPHPRPLAECVLAPAARRQSLTAGQAQLVLKAATAGARPLPRSLQALVLRAASEAGADWCESHLAVVQGLVEAAKEGLDPDTLAMVSGALCAAARGQVLARSVPLCRLLLSLLSKHCGALGGPQLRQLYDAAAATSTFMTKPCLSKLQELMAGQQGAGA